jgi:O-antigen/teichoic acid export membrane protein
MGGYAASQVLRFIGNLALAHLLIPDAFGLSTLVSAFLTGLHMFSDIGIGPSIIQSPHGDEPGFLSTAWTIQVFRGFALFVCSIGLAYPVALFYQAPELKWLLPAAGLTAAISGFNSTAVFTLNRRLAMARLMILNLVGQAASTLAMIGWALFSPTVWALVGGGVVGALVYTVASHRLITERRDRFAFDREAAKALMHFGRWIFVSTALTFFVSQGDRLIFGKMIPLAALGVYSIGLVMASIPSQAIASLALSVVFPAFSERVRTGQPMGPTIARLRVPVMLLAGYVVAGILSAGPTLIGLVYPPTYGEAAWIVQFLAVAALFQVGTSLSGSALLALGQSRWMAACSGAMLAGMLTLIPLGYAWAAFPGAVVGLVISEGLRYAVAAAGVRRQGLRVVVADVKVAAWVAVTGGGSVLLGYWMRTTSVSGWVILALQCVAVTALWVLPLLRGARLAREGR